MAIDDDELIQESYSTNPRPFWVWTGILLCLFAALFGLQWSVNAYLNYKQGKNPFTRVTNREFSVFLWENSGYMRIHQKGRTGYLPAFQLFNQPMMEPELAEKLVQAPPEVLYHYHTWNRLLGKTYIPRKIPPGTFLQFLESVQEWRPLYWAQAPEAYVQLLKDPNLLFEYPDLSVLSMEQLPLPVRKAFVGWVNFMEEGEAINRVILNTVRIREFLDSFPHYNRPFWKNLAGADYLLDLESEELLPPDQAPAFFRQAFFNFMVTFHEG